MQGGSDSRAAVVFLLGGAVIALFGALAGAMVVSARAEALGVFWDRVTPGMQRDMVAQLSQTLLNGRVPVMVNADMDVIRYSFSHRQPDDLQILYHDDRVRSLRIANGDGVRDDGDLRAAIAHHTSLLSPLFVLSFLEYSCGLVAVGLFVRWFRHGRTGAPFYRNSDLVLAVALGMWWSGLFAASGRTGLLIDFCIHGL